MTFQQALEIMVNGTEDSGVRYEAILVISAAVAEVSIYGDPDNTMQDWVSGGQYNGDETPESIAEEWDSDRD